jgi:LytS/YehU family sensor histidine kinase
MDAAADPTAPGINADDFQALEQKVLRAVELIKAEREARETEQKARLAAEAELAQLRAQFDSHATRNNVVEDELNMLRKERDAVRKRVEKMLQQLDELA